MKHNFSFSSMPMKAKQYECFLCEYIQSSFWNHHAVRVTIVFYYVCDSMMYHFIRVRKEEWTLVKTKSMFFCTSNEIASLIKHAKTYMT